jgi:hypothetical protein
MSQSLPIRLPEDSTSVEEKWGKKFHNKTMFSEGRNQPQFEDDTSYINHYLFADADLELTERLSLLTAIHFEHNIWTSGLAGDERNGAHENIYQGEVILAYCLTDSIQGFGGVQRSSCKESFESSSIKNTNVGIGIRTILKKAQPSPRDSRARLAGRARHGTSNVGPRLLVCLACPASFDKSARTITGYQLYIEILAQYNPGVLHGCSRGGRVCADCVNLSRQHRPLPSSVRCSRDTLYVNLRRSRRACGHG